MSKKNTNGNTDILTEQQQAYRSEIVGLELDARYWEAQYKKRYFALETEKIQAEYVEFQKRQEKARQDYEVYLKQLQEGELETPATIEEAAGVATAEPELVNETAVTTAE